MISRSISDYREVARRRLPRFLFDYIDGGANDEETLRRNEVDLSSILLRQRVLQDVSRIDLSTTLFGGTLAAPIILGPIGLAGLSARRGERQAARAAEAVGVPFTLSTVGACGLSEVSTSVRKPIWFQLYMIRDREFMVDLIHQAESLHCPVLVFTVDMPVPGVRHRDYRSGLAGSPGLLGKARRTAQALARPGWAWDVGLFGRPHSIGNVTPILNGKSGIEDYFQWMSDNFDPTVTWDDLRWIRERWRGTLIVKGVLCTEDAKRAAAAGADGVVVSNHGGRQLDGLPSTVRALPEIAESLRDSQVKVLVDGGIRSGVDVLRMLALGADGVMLGRAWAFALAANGQTGVEKMLKTMNNELRVAMALTGITNVADATSRILVDI